VLLPGQGVFFSQVIDNSPRFLSIGFPTTGTRTPDRLSWKGRKISLYFWRNDDAGYVFDTYVVDEVRSRGVPVLHVAHSDSIFRAQKRKSIRTKSRLPAYLYLLKRIEGAYEKPEKIPGMRCFVQDISEDGVAVMIGGKGIAGIKLKLQFYVGEALVVMSGEVKGVEYSSDRNQSLLHVQAVPPSPRMRNILLGYVFNLFNEEPAPRARRRTVTRVEPEEASPLEPIDEEEEGANSPIFL